MDSLLQKFNEFKLPFEVPFFPTEKKEPLDEDEFEKSFFLLLLPDLIIDHIFQYLSFSDLLNLRCVCKHGKFFIESKKKLVICFSTLERLGEFLESKLDTTIKNFVFDDLRWVGTPPSTPAEKPNRGFASGLMDTLIFKPIANHLLNTYIFANEMFSTFLKRYGHKMIHLEIIEEDAHGFNQIKELIAAVTPTRFEYLKMTNLQFQYSSAEFEKFGGNINGLKYFSIEQIILQTQNPIYEFFFMNCPNLEFIQIPNRVAGNEDCLKDDKEIIKSVYRPIIDYLKRRYELQRIQAANSTSASLDPDLIPIRIAFHPDAHHEFYTTSTLTPIVKNIQVFYELVECCHRFGGTMHVVPVQLVATDVSDVNFTQFQRVALKTCVKSVRVPESNQWPGSTWDSYPNGRILKTV